MKLAHAVIAALALSSTAVLANDKASDKSAQASPSTSSQSTQSGSSQSGSSQSASSSDIRQAQQALKDKGADLTVDGKMGPKTEAALKQFQQQNNLTASGQLDEKTITALNSGASDQSSSSSMPSSSENSSSASPTPSSSTSQAPSSSTSQAPSSTSSSSSYK